VKKPMLNFGILTISDKGSQGQREDKSGAAIRDVVVSLKGAVVKYEIVPDEKDVIATTLSKWADGGQVDVILTTGGTGLSKRDVTPEATLSVIDREIPGIA
jgi:molybdopterin adenylyltransferase